MSNTRDPIDADKMIASVKTSLSDAERLLREAAAATGDSAVELRERAVTSIRRTREALHDAQDVLYEKSRRAVRATDNYVHDKPWQAIAVAGVTGLLLGVLIGRR